MNMNFDEKHSLNVFETQTSLQRLHHHKEFDFLCTLRFILTNQV